MTALPEFALAVKQPWAWAIIHAGKDIENRNWLTGPHQQMAKKRGRIAIHASRSFSKAEVEPARMPEPCRWMREYPDAQKAGEAND